MHIKPYLLYLLITICLFSNCKKKDTPIAKEETTDIYVAGLVDKKPVYWKNATATILPGGINNEGFATAIAVQGSDVYVAGTVPTNTPYATSSIGVYWKNGVKYSLGGSEGGSWALGIAVLGSDVYVVGYAYNGGISEACYWKNGIKTVLGTNPAYSRATGIVVFGSDVYICATGNAVAYWKNGIKVTLPLGALGGTAQDIAVNDLGDIVICGYENFQTPAAMRSRPIYWKNGAIMQIPVTDTYSTYLKAVTLQGNEVYTAGFDLYNTPNFRALYFKNTSLITTTSGPTALANDIAVKGTDVYTVGTTGSFSANNTTAMMWKNGEGLQLSQGVSEANAIAIIRH